MAALRNATTVRRSGSPSGEPGAGEETDHTAVTMPPAETEVVSPELALVDPALRQAVVSHGPPRTLYAPEPAPYAQDPAHEDPDTERHPPEETRVAAPRRRVSAFAAALLLLGGAAVGAVGALAALGRDGTTTTRTTTTTLTTTSTATTPAAAPKPGAGSGYTAAGGLRFRVGDGATEVADVSVPLQCGAKPAALPPLRISPALGFSFNGSVREPRRTVHIRIDGKFIDSTIATVVVSESARGCVSPTRIYIARLT